ncbi:uncharacterized protein LOC110981999 [Acanthaster planci]|uniref:Uncharacterized protein LOC110981999 n=1 Tax=Acanthaster planci TaxID=133434 RepID=A0A8B7YTJ1_ACAPL|nr:uncharacterized protein LOC110981999 [Acanthaster planci]
MESKPAPIQPVEGRLSEQSRYRPFNLHWLDSALHETLLPGSPWEQVHARISQELVKSLQLDLANMEEERKQMILHLLGPMFVKQYMESMVPRPEVLAPSALGVERKKQLQRATQVLLRDKLDLVIRELGYAPMSSNASTPVTDRQQDGDRAGEQGRSDMQAVIDHARGILETGLKRDLVIHEMRQKQEQPDPKDVPTSVSNIKLSSKTSDHLGMSLIAILQRDPTRLDSVCRRLSGKQLPQTLRSYLWAEILLRMAEDGGGGGEKSSEKAIRKKFAKAVSKGKVDMKITKATECPIGGLIETAVKERFDATPCMQAHRLGKIHRQAREALNVLYTYNRSYEPFLIDWIFPLQLAFHDRQMKEEHPYELALYLDLLNTYAFPKWPEIFAVAEQAMARLKMADKELYDHLQHCAISNVKVNPQDFLVHLIHAEKRKAAALSWSVGTEESNDPSADSATKELLASPIIFLRKWVGEGFVCVLNCSAMMYIWDQCFVERWDRQVLEDACLALLLLLKEKFMDAVDYHQMRQVFLNEPSQILTLDLVRSYQHTRGIQPLDSVPDDLNSRNSVKPQESVVTSPQATPEPSAVGDTVPSTPRTPQEVEPQPETVRLRRAGLSNVRLKLMWNLTKSQLADFQTEKLLISIMVSIGDKTLKVKDIKDLVAISSFAKGDESQAKVKSLESTAQESTKVKYQLSVPVPQILFSEEEVDLLKYSKELDPQVVLTIQYRATSDEGGDGQEDSKTSVGWALIPVYEKTATPSTLDGNQDGTDRLISTWTPCKSDRTVPLYFGDVPQDVAAEGAMKEFAEEDLLQEGSEVSLTVFDPVDSVWIMHDPSEAVQTDREVPPEQGFDLYIDGIRFLPDNATICKVTGRVALPTSEHRPDVLALPLLDSAARCPKFEYRYTLPLAQAGNLVLLRVYTVDKFTRSVVVVGALPLQLYVGESTKKLNVGAFQLRLHAGMLQMNELTVESFAKLPIIPACSLLVRLLPRSEEFIPAPDYASSCYSSETCKPSSSEQRVMGHYKNSSAWSDTVRDVLQRLRDVEKSTEDLTDEEVTAWSLDRLDFKKHSDPDTPFKPELMDLVRCVDYDEEQGLYVSVLSAKAVKGDGKYTNISVYVLPGSDVASKGELHPSDSEHFLVQDAKSSSQQTSPVFKDQPKKLHPSYSPRSLLLLRVIGLSVTYKPDPANQGPGQMFSKDGTQPVSLESDSRLGWSLLPLFDNGCVAQGTYLLPVFQDSDKFSFLKELSDTPDFYGWIVSALQKGTIMLDTNYASIVVTLWDGHFDKGETIPLRTEDKFLNVDDFQKFAAAAEGVRGQPVSDLILQSLPPEAKEEGVLSEIYWREEERFQDVMRTTFKDVIDKMKLTEDKEPDNS